MDNYRFFTKTGFLGLKREEIDPFGSSWPKNTWIEIGPVVLKLTSTQFTIFSEHPELYWSRDEFFDMLSMPNLNALTFLSAANNIMFATTDSWEAEMYAASHNVPYHHFSTHPFNRNFKFKIDEQNFVSIAYRKI